MKDGSIINPKYTSSNDYNELKSRLNNSRFRINDVNTFNQDDISNYSISSTYSRPNKYSYWVSKEGLLLLEGFARDGKSHNLIAKEIGISLSSLLEWKKKFPQINRALSQTREVVIRTLENAAMKSALGYTATVIKPLVVKKAIYGEDDKVVGYEEVVEYVAEEEFIKPEWNMQQFLLKNIAPDKYKGDAKQIAEALNEEKIQQVLAMQQSFQTALAEISMQDLENENVVVIEDDESTNNSSK